MKSQTTPRATVTLATSQYGTRQPTLEYLCPEDMGYRARHAMAHRIAAAVECETLADQDWVVVIQEHTEGYTVRVHLELITGDINEATSGVLTLTAVASRLNGGTF